jgi:hypothetical protein
LCLRVADSAYVSEIAMEKTAQLGASFAALEAYTRRLETDTKGKGPAGYRMVAAARWFLWSCATCLLFAPEETLSRASPGINESIVM